MLSVGGYDGQKLVGAPSYFGILLYIFQSQLQTFTALFRWLFHIGKQFNGIHLPKKNEAVLLPKNLGNKTSEIILKLAHQQSDAVVYWYLDETFVGKTENFHELILAIEPGEYVLTAVDNQGNRVQQLVEVRSASGN